MNLNAFLPAAVVTAAFTLNLGAAEVSGKITLKGTPPPAVEVFGGGQQTDCGKLHPNGLKTQFYVVGDGAALADVLVYVKEGLAGKKFPAPAKPLVIDQKDCLYVPYVTTAQAGQKILVRNSDQFMHNVHPVPAAVGNKEANKAQPAGFPDLEFTFDNPEMFLKFTCNVHNWMFSYVSVLEHPFHGVSGKDGAFSIKDLPPGKYTIEAWHRKAGKASKEITVGADNQKVDFTLEVPAPQ